MGKYKYTTEFEIRANNKMLFNYLVTPAGLAQWFADKVSIDEYKILILCGITAPTLPV
jgi:uncharacterized protein YndB with AHSA1/START domain